MEINDDESTRPSIGFPLGLALLLLMLLCMSGLFSCCIHWDKLRSLLFHDSSSSSSSQHHLDDDIEADGAVHAQMKVKQQDGEKEEGGDEKMVGVVLMPGDEFPKFVAMACPCHPPLWEKLVVIQVHNPITFHVMSSS